ncbi:MAG: flavodoxin family protein [Nitrospiraceae bacterium]|nr:flavodoxin family protein [Nitrospiraceae bacterium]
MKIISLLASPHGLKGNTAGLLRDVHEGAEPEGARIETVVLKGGTVLPCLGCDACHKKGFCVQKDEFEPIKKKIAEADGLVLASPNYILNVSAQLKAFMDRCCGVVHCMQFWDKYGVSVVTSGGDGGESVAGYMDYFLITVGAVPAGSVWASVSEMTGTGFKDDVREKARALGKRLVEAWRAGEMPPGVEKRRNDFLERMRALMAWRGEEWPYEHRYWKENRGL